MTVIEGSPGEGRMYVLKDEPDPKKRRRRIFANGKFIDLDENDKPAPKKADR